MKLAAVDIGSNAIRLQITNVTKFNGQINFKRVEYVRFPLRLGNDVFNHKMISPANETKFIKLMQAFKLMIDLYEVDDYMVCATSAMRESKNGRDIAAKVLTQHGLKINIIDGEKEAFIINKALWSYIDDKTYLHIDVGGGSTELNLYVNKEKIASKSFKIGSVRTLQTTQNNNAQVWGKMQEWIQTNMKLKKLGLISAIGTGGNINKIFDMGATKKSKRVISIEKIEKVIDHISQYSLEERINLLQLNPDRADVIIPASNIYLTAMKAAKAKRMLVPDVGLKDGLMTVLFERNQEKFGL